MNMIVPTLGLDVSLLQRLDDSIDYPIQQKFVILNSRSTPMDGWLQQHQDWRVIREPDNLGAAGSWNKAPSLFPNDPAWIICNDDIAFPRGHLKRICDCADKYATTDPIILLNDTNPFYCFVWTSKGVEDFGLFDENFWPAYYEDNDMRVRHRLSGVKYRYALQGLPPLIHNKPRLGGMDYSAMIQGCGLFNRRYWKLKWGTDPANTTSFENTPYSTPFNAHGLPTSWWTMIHTRRRNMQSIFDTFMSGLNPSLYDSTNA